MGFVPLKQESQQTQQLRDIAAQLGIQGAQPIDANQFIGSASTNNRNEAIQNLNGFDVNSAKVRLSNEELNKQIADTLRTSGPAAFRNLRDVFGANTVQSLQNTLDLKNVPSSVLPTAKSTKPSQFVTTGNTSSDNLAGFRQSLQQSLKPPTREQALRTSAVKQVQRDTVTNKRDELANSIAQQQQEYLNSKNPQQPGILENLLASAGISGTPSGIGGKFLSNLFNRQPNEVSAPITSVASPDTGEIIDFNGTIGNVDPRVKQLEDDAAIAISQGADKAQVHARLAQALQQLKGTK